MTNKETAEQIRRHVASTTSPFSWPTDGCGYEQHARFVDHRNANWRGGDWERFCLDYALALENEEELKRVADAREGVESEDGNA